MNLLGEMVEAVQQSVSCYYFFYGQCASVKLRYCNGPYLGPGSNGKVYTEQKDGFESVYSSGVDVLFFFLGGGLAVVFAGATWS